MRTLRKLEHSINVWAATLVARRGSAALAAMLIYSNRAGPILATIVSMLRAVSVLLLTTAIAFACGGAGFRTRRLLDEHYLKHGDQFGKVSKAQYLCLAQDLRDAPAGNNILEQRRPDGIVSRFDRRNGYFGAFNGNGTIRTFFIPNDGERYFRRQAERDYD